MYYKVHSRPPESLNKQLPPGFVYSGSVFFSSVLSDLFRFATFFWDNHQQGLKPPTRKPCLFLQDDDFHYNVSDSFSVGVGSTTNYLLASKVALGNEQFRMRP